MSFTLRFVLVIAVLIGATITVFSLERPSVVTVQQGFRGTGMDAVINPRLAAARQASATQQVPEVVPRVPAVGPKAGAIYRNVQVLGDLSVGEFARTMAALTSWVAPAQGCNYCHNPANMASDEIYTKVVSRRMLQMVARINAEWKPHVAETGVTCYTCHRGNPVPAYVWAQDDGMTRQTGFAASNAGQNHASPITGSSSLPYDPFTSLLAAPGNIRIATQTALPSGNPVGIKETEVTYGLMMHFSNALGVNCTACHNSRSFSDWAQSPPQRATAWHGIRMVRDINANYIDPLAPVFQANRNGPPGGPEQARVGPQHNDPLKVNCSTCHQGVNKPLYGVSMLRDYPELNAVRDQGAPAPIRR